VLCPPDPEPGPAVAKREVSANQVLGRLLKDLARGAGLGLVSHPGAPVTAGRKKGAVPRDTRKSGGDFKGVPSYLGSAGKKATRYGVRRNAQKAHAKMPAMHGDNGTGSV